MPIDPLIIGAGLNVVSNLFSNSGKNKREQEARRFNLEQWNRENAYNHPIQQMARLKEAGLNPNMVYGGSTGQAVGNSTGTVRGKAPEYDLKSPLGTLDIDQAKSLRQQVRIGEKQADKLGQETTNLATIDAINGVKLGLDKATQEDLIATVRSRASTEKYNALKSEIDYDIMNETQRAKVDKVNTELSILKAQKGSAEAQKTIDEWKAKLTESGMSASDSLLFRALMTLFNRFGPTWEQAKDYYGNISKSGPKIKM